MQGQARLRRLGRQILWTVGAVVAVSTVVFVINHFFVHHPLWDWLKLLIVPVVLAGGGLWFNAQQREREQRIANDRAQDEALQSYLDQMSDMLIPGEGQPSLYKARPGDSLSSVARARTLTVLPRLDGERKARVVQFLYESGLIDKDRLILGLEGADLSGARLGQVNLSQADLLMADLRGASLGLADLRGASLRGADLSWAHLRGGYLREAYLLGADLRGADLEGANLRMADLRGADHSRASGINNEVVAQRTVSLEGATMPNGQKYEDWLKDREGRREDGENSGTS